MTATRQNTVRAEVPSATELVEISSPQIVARQNVGEALAQSQSVFVREYGSVSGLKTISLRGAGDGQILALAAGVRLNNPQSGGVDASLLSLVGIDKIEIVRGNASAQYGSDAIGGVIHLRSFQLPSGFSSAVQTSGGSFGTFNSRAQFGYGLQSWRGSVVVARLVSDGNFSIDDAVKIKRQNNASQRRDQRYTDPDPFFPIDSHHEVASDLGVLQNRARLHNTLDVLAGGEAGHYHLTSTDLGKPERTQRSAFAQAEWQPFAARRKNIWQIKIIPSLRYDDYSDAGQRTSPKLALALNRETSTRFNLHGSLDRWETRLGEIRHRHLSLLRFQRQGSLEYQSARTLQTVQHVSRHVVVAAA